jgi:hypothetical protein
MKKILFVIFILSFNTYSQSNFSTIIGNPVEIGDLLVAEYDFPEPLTYSDAKKKYKNGWRLPTKDEHQNIICPNKSKIPNLKHTSYYWSSTEGDKYNIGDKLYFNVFYKLMYTDCDNGSYFRVSDNDSRRLQVRLVKRKQQ